MSTDSSGERLLTELDHVRLNRLLGRHHQPDLDEVLAQTAVVASHEVTADTVTMNSRVEVSDLASGRRQILTLCYPQDADPAQGRISVLSPAGAALIGRRAASLVAWQQPGGQVTRVRLVRILFQPEASGDYLA